MSGKVAGGEELGALGEDACLSVFFRAAVDINDMQWKGSPPERSTRAVSGDHLVLPPTVAASDVVRIGLLGGGI